jgi:hypothetical protein
MKIALKFSGVMLLTQTTHAHNVGTVFHFSFPLFEKNSYDIFLFSLFFQVVKFMPVTRRNCPVFGARCQRHPQTENSVRYSQGKKHCPVTPLHQSASFYRMFFYY